MIPGRQRLPRKPDDRGGRQDPRFAGELSDAESVSTISRSSYTVPNGHKLDAYEKIGGYVQAKRALGMSRDALLVEMKAANIRGRGGAGFRLGVKWGFMPWPPKPEKPHYLVINADEGGPPARSKIARSWSSTLTRASRAASSGCFGIGAHAGVHLRA